MIKLETILACAEKFVYKENDRYGMHHISLKKLKDKIEIVATNGHMLFFYEYDNNKGVLEKIFAKSETDQVLILPSEFKMAINGLPFKIETNAIYPKYESLINNSISGISVDYAFFNAAYLRTISSVLKKLNKLKTCVVFNMENQEKVMHIDFECGKILIMPILPL